MRVCFVSHTARLGGAERSLLQLIEGLNKRGVECLVCLPKDGPLERRLNQIASIVKSTYNWWTVPRGSRRKNLTRHFKKHVTESIRLTEKLRSKNLDIILTNTSVVCEGAIAARILSIPHVWHIRELGEKDHGFIFKFGLSNTSRLINELSDVVVFNSQAALSEFEKYTDFKKSHVVYNFVSIDRKLLKQKPKINYKHANSYKIIVVGTISRKKGQIDAVKAVVRLLKKGFDIELILMGECRNEGFLKRIRSLIKESGNPHNFQVVGFQENPYSAMKQANLVLVCSKNEAFGRTILEGMLLKKPVIGPRTGGIPEIIKNGENGLLYKSGNYIELSSKIQKLITDKSLRNRIIKNGYTTSTRGFSEDNYSGKMLEIFQSVDRGVRDKESNLVDGINPV